MTHHATSRFFDMVFKPEMGSSEVVTLLHDNVISVWNVVKDPLWLQVTLKDVRKWLRTCPMQLLSSGKALVGARHLVHD
jgi:hypothetical protein